MTGTVGMLFGFFRSKKAATPLATGPDGRPRPPAMSGMGPEETTEGERITALEWASVWTGDAHPNPRKLLRHLNVLIGGGARRNLPAMGRATLLMAFHAVGQGTQRNRSERTRRGLPFFALRLGPADPDDICAAARDRAGVVSEDIPVIPLAECDRQTCKCWYRQMSRRQGARARSEGH